MMNLRLAGHDIKPDTNIVEIWDGDKLMAAIYPTNTGIKILSKHFAEVLAEDGAVGLMLPDLLTFFVMLKPVPASARMAE